MTGPVDDPTTAPVDSAEVLRAVLAAAVDQAILAADPTGTVVLASLGAERLLGYPAGALVGRPLTALLPDHHLSAVPDRTDPAQLRTLVRRDGTPVRALVSVGPLRSDTGLVAGAVLVAWAPADEHRAADALRRAFEREQSAAVRLSELSRIRDDFVANVSHELRTPLTTVVGNTEMLLDGDAGELTAPQRRLLSAVERNARRLQTLVGDLLMLSRIQSGKISMTVRPVVVQHAVQQALAQATEQPATHPVRLRIELAAEPLVVEGDGTDLVRMVGNILGNALKFTPAGGRVTVRVARDGRYARIEVADTGIGIPAGELDRVFDGFFRSSRAQRNESPGTGLGLTIARSIADRHAGTIEISRTDPEGTAVAIRLPLAEDQELTINTGKSG